MNPVLSIICIALNVATLVLFARVIWSWFPPPREGPLLAIYRVLLAVTEPVLKPLRSAIPPLRMGMVGLDVSVLVVFVVLVVLRQAIC